MAARGRRAEPPGREAPGPRQAVAAGADGLSRGGDIAGEGGRGDVEPGVGRLERVRQRQQLPQTVQAEVEEEQRQRQEEPPPGPPRPDQPATAAGGPGDPKRKGGRSPTLSFVGRRRGGNKLALKTGIVAKKQKTEDELLTSKGDAQAQYMAEVKKYKAHQCGDDDKTRPLVK